MEKDYRFDLIRAIAIIMVVTIHSSVILFEYCALETTSVFEKAAYSLLEIRFIAVPLFVMLSGALLLGKSEPIGLFFKKRLSKILLPFIVWSLIAFTISFIQEGGKTAGEWFRGFFDNVIVGMGAHSIYWYVYMIVALYLFTPVLRLLFEKADKQHAYYFFALMFVCTIAFLVFPDVYFFENISCLFFEYLTYFIGGYVIYRYIINEPWFPVVSKILLGTGMLMLACRFFITNDFGAYLHPVKLIPAFALYGLILKETPNRKILMGGGIKGSLIASLSEYSYGIYLSHFLFISILIRIPCIKNLYPFVEFITVTLTTLALNILMLWVLKKIGLRKLFM